MKDYQYPIDYLMYNQQEIAIIINFLSAIEDINEGKKVSDIKDRYKNYRNVMNSVSAEKQMDKEFQEVSGYSIYKTMKEVL